MSVIQRALPLVQMLGNLLAVPHKLQQQSQAADQQRAILGANAKSLGLTPEQIEQAAPKPGMSFLNPAEHPGTYGKILSGVGDVGSILGSVLGNEDAPPRMPVSELTSLAELKRSENAAAGTAAWRQSQLDQKHDTFEETKRHNRAVENKHPAGAAGETDPAMKGLPAEYRAWLKDSANKGKSFEEFKRAMGKISAETAGDRTKETADAKREFGSLPPRIQEEVANVRETVRMMDEIEAIANTPEGAARIGPILGRYNAGKYGVGMEDDPLTVKINTLAQRVSLMGGATIMRFAGTRAMQALNQMQQHFSQPYDNSTEFFTKLHENRDSLINGAKEGVRVVQQSPDELLSGLGDLDTGPYKGQPKKGEGDAQNLLPDGGGGATGGDSDKWHKALDDLGVPR